MNKSDIKKYLGADITEVCWWLQQQPCSADYYRRANYDPLVENNKCTSPSSTNNTSWGTATPDHWFSSDVCWGIWLNSSPSKRRIAEIHETCS
jgi:hypothetical protein